MIRVKEGEFINRYLGGIDKPMSLKVTEVTDSRIICGPWQFDKLTGAEIDEELGWGPLSGTGSYIRPEQEPSNN